MSIKIYNAYRMRIRSLTDMHRFITACKQECLKQLQNNYNILYLRQAAQLIDDLVLHEERPLLSKELYQDFQAHLNHLLQKAEKQNTNVLSQYLNPVDNTTRMQEHRIIWSLVQDIVCNKIRTNTSQETVSPLNIHQELVYFPIDDESICFIAYGTIFNALLNDALHHPTNDKFHKLCQEFQLADFHYQNQTDAPDDISYEEYEKRYETWKRVMPSMIPAKDGIVIPFIDTHQLASLTYNNAKDIQWEKILPKERANKIAMQIIEARCLQAVPNTEYTANRFSALRKLHEELKNPNSHEFQEFQQLEQTLESLLPNLHWQLMSQTIQEFLTTRKGGN